MIDADEDGPCRLVSPPHHDDGDALRLAAAQIRPDPDLTLDPHAVNIGYRYGAAAVLVRSRPVTRFSSRNSSGVMRPVSRILRSCWNTVMAWVVEAPMAPSTGPGA